MDAKVTIVYRINNVCTKEDLIQAGMTFEEMVRDLINEEHIVGVAEDDPEIVSVEEITP